MNFYRFLIFQCLSAAVLAQNSGRRNNDSSSDSNQDVLVWIVMVFGGLVLVLVCNRNRVHNTERNKRIKDRYLQLRSDFDNKVKTVAEKIAAPSSGEIRDIYPIPGVYEACLKVQDEGYIKYGYHFWFNPIPRESTEIGYKISGYAKRLTSTGRGLTIADGFFNACTGEAWWLENTTVHPGYGNRAIGIRVLVTGRFCFDSNQNCFQGQFSGVTVLDPTNALQLANHTPSSLELALLDENECPPRILYKRGTFVSFSLEQRQGATQDYVRLQN